MYLSRVEIDESDRRKIHDLTHLGAYHGWVESCFPDEFEKEERSRKLWRIDRLEGKSYLLIVSSKKPDLCKMEKYGVPSSAAVKDYDSFLQNVKEGKTYRFRATLNPVRAVSRGENTRGVIMPEITAEHQLAYLERKAEKNGFQLLPGQYDITERRYEYLRKKGGHTIKISVVSFEGMLKVTDEIKFREALTAGIGREKAFGCGLMTVIPTK